MTTATLVCLILTGVYLLGLGIFAIVKFIVHKHKVKKELEQFENE